MNILNHSEMTNPQFDTAPVSEGRESRSRLAAKAKSAALAIDGLFFRPDADTGSAQDIGAYRMRHRLKDFVRGSLTLFWQRQAMFVGVGLMAAYFYNVTLAIACYLVCLASEMLDLYFTRRILNDDRDQDFPTQFYVASITFCQIFSAFAISLFAVVISWYEGPSFHFTPLFLLFAAALFAAVNNHQLPQLILIKLVIYGLTFLFIPVRDLVIEQPAWDSFLWLQFLTVVFVLYFIIDCSRIFILLYKKTLVQLDRLRVERDRAMQAAEAKTQFLSTVSHELKTPLTSVKGSLDLIKSGGFGDVPDKMQPLFDLAGKNSDRLLLLINDLLDMQKMDSRDLKFRFAEVNPWTLVTEAISAISHHAQSANIEIIREGSDEGLAIRADHSRMLQVMGNILSNAIKFSKADTKITVSVKRAAKTVIISVKDQGIGIDPAHRSLIFEPFSQVDSSDTRSIGGTGLGMNITRRILDRHNARIDFTSVLGVGTTFYVTFDLLDSELLEIGQPAKAS